MKTMVSRGTRHSLATRGSRCAENSQICLVCMTHEHSVHTTTWPEGEDSLSEQTLTYRRTEQKYITLTHINVSFKKMLKTCPVGVPTILFAMLTGQIKDTSSIWLQSNKTNKELTTEVVSISLLSFLWRDSTFVFRYKGSNHCLKKSLISNEWLNAFSFQLCCIAQIVICNF